MAGADSRILLLRFGGLGDLLAVLPSIVYLRKIFPGRFFSLVCREEYGRLFLEAGMVDEIIPLDGPRARLLFSGVGGADPAALLRFAGDTVLAVGWMQKPPDPEMREGLNSPGLPPFHFIFPPAAVPIPVSRYFFDETRSRFPESGRRAPGFEECARLRLERGAGTNGISWPGPSKGKVYAVVHPGSGGEGKRWPLENFLEILRRLTRKKIPGVLVTGDAEEKLSGILEKEKLPPGWAWVRRPPVPGLARLLSGASFYVGNDSGVTHLAAACGTRVLALFRKDLEPAWKPYGRVRIIAARSLPEISPESVWRGIEEMLSVFSCF